MKIFLDTANIESLSKAIRSGISAVSQLSGEGISCAVTLVFSIAQAITAACAGASYVAPFVGRLDDSGSNGIEMVRDIKATFEQQNVDTQIIAASIRSVETVERLFTAGCDIVTMPINIFNSMFHHSLTDIGLKKFIEDANTVTSSAIV